ncbi:MAG: ABC transporter permease [Deltaproteobacteria bacterium]|nr:ABC transporter permease [Deltaproteobacteria bacterium]
MRPFDKQYFSLLREMVISQFKLKDQSTFLGLVWSLLHPLLMLGVLFVFFNLEMGKNVDHYPLYLLIGLVHYTHFATGTSAGMTALAAMRGLTRDAVFPKEVLVIASVVVTSIEFIISLVICVVIAFFTSVKFSWASTLLPLVLLLQTTMVLWISLILSCCYIFLKDINHIYQVFLRLLMFITPIFYDTSFLGNGIARYIVLLNPLMYPISFTRNVIIEGEPFPARLFIMFGAVNALFTYFSLRAFRRCESVFAERI